MRVKVLFYVIVIGLITSFTDLSAQSMSSLSSSDMRKVKVSELSDQQLQAYWKNAKAQGLSDNDIYKIAGQKGLPSKELAELKKRMAIIQSGGAKDETPGIKSAEPQTTGYVRDTVPPATPPPVKRPSRIFGYNFFSNPDFKNSFQPNQRIATPKSYVLGVGDDIIVNVSGLNETSFTAKIDPEGRIEIPHAGLAYINGLSIEQAERVIRQRMQRIYPALSSGQTQLSIALGSVRSITVSILGETLKPGSYSISALSNIINALYQSGGPTDRGSLRNIRINRGGKTIRTVDLYPFIQEGLFDTGIRLEDQDVIFLPIYKKRVAIGGEVKNPGLYELKDSETLSNLIQYAGGFSDLAYQSMARINRIDEKELSVKNVKRADFDKFILNNADSVSFDAVSKRVSNRVVILGAVNRPGEFELSQGMTLKSLILNADGPRDDAFQGGYIKRTKPNLEKQSLSFDLQNILNGNSDITLQREDSVIIASRNTLSNEFSVTIGGYVKVPGTYTYRQGMRLGDLISMAGGFTEDAASHRTEITRLLKDRSDIVANQLSSSLIKNIDSTLNNMDAAFLLEPKDDVNVPRLVNYHALGTVRLTGEVVFPGNYPIQRRDETAPEFITRANGVTPIGSLANAQVFRNGSRVNMDITKNTKDQILMDGDSIYVPRETTFVEVMGEVNNPQLISYRGSGFKYYVNAAGGSTDSASLKGAYVRYPDGTNQPVKKFLFFRNYPSITPGAKITVPVKPQRNRLGIGEISALTSVFTALITLVAILVK